MSGHCELCGETGGHSAACVSNPYQAANQRVIIATLTADLARLTAELAEERRQHKHTMMGADIEAQRADELLANQRALKAELERSRREVDRMRSALEIIAGRRQCADNTMSNVDVVKAALSAGGKE